MEKKEGSMQQFDFVSDIDSLLSSYDHAKEHELVAHLFPAIKKVFSELFFLPHHFTFEELAMQIHSFEHHCDFLTKKIAHLHNNQKELLGQKHSKKKHDTIEKIKEGYVLIEETEQQYTRCRHVATILENPHVQNTVIQFCHRLSHLQFSGKKLNHDGITDILFTFLWIVNHFLYEFKEEPLNGKQLLFSKQKKEQHDKNEVEALIEKTRELLDDGEITHANYYYKRLLQYYQSLSKQDQGSLYTEVFILWFELHFYKRRVRVHHHR